MAKKKVSTEEVVEKTPTESKSSVTVTWSGGSRTYTKAIHGEDFKDLAKEFAKKHGGELA